MEEFEVTSEHDGETIRVMSYGPQHAIELGYDRGMIGVLNARVVMNREPDAGE